jgi:hypothetical protein
VSRRVFATLSPANSAGHFGNSELLPDSFKGHHYRATVGTAPAATGRRTAPLTCGGLLCSFAAGSEFANLPKAIALWTALRHRLESRQRSAKAGIADFSV